MSTDRQLGRFQFSLKSLFVTVTFIAICLPLLPVIVAFVVFDFDNVRWLSDTHERWRKKWARNRSEKP